MCQLYQDFNLMYIMCYQGTDDPMEIEVVSLEREKLEVMRERNTLMEESVRLQERTTVAVEGIHGLLKHFVETVPCTAAFDVPPIIQFEQ
jgi:hypothetical protein